MKYQIEAKVVSFLFSSSLIHLIHFNPMFTCSSSKSLLIHMGYYQMQFKLHMGPFKIVLYVI